MQATLQARHRWPLFARLAWRLVRVLFGSANAESAWAMSVSCQLYPQSSERLLQALKQGQQPQESQWRQLVDYVQQASLILSVCLAGGPRPIRRAAPCFR